MALPTILAQAARAAAKKQYVEKLARTVYRDSRGRMVSYQKYKDLRSQAVTFESQRRKQWGKPPAGWTWTRIANKYPDKFQAYM